MQRETIIDQNLTQHSEVFFIRILVVGYPFQVLLLQRCLALNPSLSQLIYRLLNFFQECQHLVFWHIDASCIADEVIIRILFFGRYKKFKTAHRVNFENPFRVLKNLVFRSNFLQDRNGPFTPFLRFKDTPYFECFVEVVRVFMNQSQCNLSNFSRRAPELRLF